MRVVVLVGLVSTSYWYKQISEAIVMIILSVLLVPNDNALYVIIPIVNNLKSFVIRGMYEVCLLLITLYTDW